MATKQAEPKQTDTKQVDVRQVDKKPADGKPGGKESPGAAPKAPTKLASKKKLLIVAGTATALLAGGGTAAYFLLGSTRNGGEAHVEEKRAEPRRTPVFVDLDSFTVNLHDDDSDRFIQVKLVAVLKDAASGEVLKNMMPAVRNEVLLLLGSKRVDDISTRAGKETLANEIVVAVNKPLAGTSADKAVESVNFTQLIIQ